MSHRTRQTLARLSRLGSFGVFLLFLLIGTVSTPAPAQAAPAGAALPANRLLQFQAADHLLGFTSQQVYLAALDHALSVQFVNSLDALPVADNAATASTDAAGGNPLPFAAVTYTNVWPGVTVRYAAVADGIAKSTYTVAPGADPRRIQLRYNVPLSIDSDGALAFQLASTRGALAESAPVAWQEIDDARVPVDVTFAIAPDNTVGFQLGAFDPRYPLTIDPIYRWHTFAGAGSRDDGMSVVTDSAGNVYIAGMSDRSWLGPSFTNPKHAYNGGRDIVVVKLNSQGNYLWHTFYGSAADDDAYVIRLDGSNNIYVAGDSNGTWGSSPLHAFTGADADDIVVFKLDTSGNLLWNTFYGSTAADRAQGMFVENGGAVIVTGSSYYSWQGPAAQNPINPLATGFDIFVLKLTNLGAYSWHTFLGSSGHDHAQSITQDGAGNLYIAGYSAASWGTNIKHAYTGGVDIMVVALNSGGGYSWNTFYGSTGIDEGDGIVLGGSNLFIAGTSSASWQGNSGANPLHAHSGGDDLVVLSLTLGGSYNGHSFYGSSADDIATGISYSTGNLYLSGFSAASWQGDSSANPKHAHSGGFDLTVLSLNDLGVYQWHTFYGTSGDDRGRGIAVDPVGDVLLVGTAELAFLGDASTAPRSNHTGLNDIALVALYANGSYWWHTFHGSSSDDVATSLALDGSGNIYVAGTVNSSWGNFTSEDHPLHLYTGASDLFVLKLDSSGARLWYTFYGSVSDDEGRGIALDSSDNVYVTGYSAAEWEPYYTPSPKHAHSGSQDIFVLKLDKDGAYQWHTFWGSANIDMDWGIAVDGAANVYVDGMSMASWLGDGGALPKNPFAANMDLVVLSLDSSGVYRWHTFYGGTGVDSAGKLALDASGSVLITGRASSNFLVNGANPKHAYSGSDYDIVVVKLTTGGVYQWHTFYGGTGADVAVGIDVDPAGNVYAVGNSGATWLGDGSVTPRHPYSASNDFVVLALDSAGAYRWHTFYGSANSERGYGIDVDPFGNLYVTGASGGNWLGDGSVTPKHPYAGVDDITILKLNTQGDYQWHTFYGSFSPDEGWHIVRDNQGNLFVAGYAGASWRGDASADPLHPFTDPGDGFILKLSDPSAVYLPYLSR